MPKSSAGLKGKGNAKVYKDEWYLIASTYPNANMYQPAAFRMAFGLEPWATEPGNIFETGVFMRQFMSDHAKTMEDIYKAACDAYYQMSGDHSLRAP